MDAQPVDEQPPPDLRALAERLQELCLAGGWTVATAESCTGGLVADLLTDVPGSSGYVRGGIVSYADDVKIGQLGVAGELIRAHGAVSPHVARAMAVGARDRLGATFAVSVTGIAGPDGGSPAKPVGLTYVGVAGPSGVDVRRYAWPGDRAANKRSSAGAAIELLLEAATAEARRAPDGGDGADRGAAAAGSTR
jgi:nicotinamide-nucleotide amidase